MIDGSNIGSKRFGALVYDGYLYLRILLFISNKPSLGSPSNPFWPSAMHCLSVFSSNMILAILICMLVCPLSCQENREGLMHPLLMAV